MEQDPRHDIEYQELYFHLILIKIHVIFLHSPHWKRIRYKIKKILDSERHYFERFPTFERYCIRGSVSVGLCVTDRGYLRGRGGVLEGGEGTGFRGGCWCTHGGRVTRIIQKRASGGGGRVTGHPLIPRPSPCNQPTCGRIVLIPSPLIIVE